MGLFFCALIFEVLVFFFVHAIVPVNYLKVNVKNLIDLRVIDES
jgi:hypothetical protein